jgi:hypothetical protein
LLSPEALSPEVAAAEAAAGVASMAPAGALQLGKTFPHLWPPFTAQAPHPAGLYRGQLAKEVWVDGDPRRR